MKTRILILCLLSGVTLLHAQEKMYIHKTDKMTLGAPVQATDSIWFVNSVTAFFRIGDTLVNYPVNEIDSMTFGDPSNIVDITYNGAVVAVVNPFAFEGVLVTVENGDVTVASTTETAGIQYRLQGSTTDGKFKIYSASAFELILNGVNVLNPDGPAINIQSKKDVAVTLATGTANILTDGVTYATAPNSEDQKGTFFSEGKLTFGGNGSLTIHSYGSAQHALCTDKALIFNASSLTVTRATKDALHAKGGLQVSGGTMNLTATGDGIDGDVAYISITGGSVTTVNNSADTKGIACDSTLTISGGIVNVTVTGAQSKGIKSETAITLSGGTITVLNSGAAVLVASGLGYDPSYCSAIKCDADILLSGATVTINTTGLAGKGISSDGSITMTAGSLNITNSGNGATYNNELGVKEAYVATCLSADVDLILSGGTITTSSSGSAGKGFSGDRFLTIGTATSSPVIQVTTTGSRILISGSGSNADYAEAKAMKSDSTVTINNGTITIASADDGIKSEHAVILNQGVVNINNSKEGVEAPFITINNGEIKIKSTDDCFNATFGLGGELDDGSLLTFNGGYTVASTTAGDGLDSNGDILFTGGTIIVHGPQQAPEVGMDYNGQCNMNGGFLVISGTNSNMTQAPQSTSLQRSLKIMSAQMLSSSTLFHIQTSAGANILTFKPERNYYSIIFSSNELVQGGNYSIYTGGTSTGTNSNGLYTGGVYSGGTFRKSFTINSIVTNVSF